MSLAIITNQHDEHADMVIEELNRRGVIFYRVNTETFPVDSNFNLRMNANAVKADIQLAQRFLPLEEITHVWYRRPLDPVPDSAITDTQHVRIVVSETTSLMKTFWYLCTNAKWVNALDSNRKAREKGYNMYIARELGFQIPDTLFTSNPIEAKAFFDLHCGNIIMKPLDLIDLVVDGKRKTVYTNKLGPEFLDQLEGVKYSPVILQECVIKDLELRVTVFGHQVFAAAIYSQETELGKNDWRQAIYSGLRYEAFELPSDISNKCLEITEKLGLQFSTIDLILTPDGKYVFLEVNPNGQWVWLELATDQPMVNAMVSLLTE